MTDLKKLTEPFPKDAIKWRWADRAQTRRLDYVEGHTIIHRLNDATGNQWSLTVDKIERFPINDQNVMVMAHVTLEIPDLGRRSHIGVQAVNERGGEDLVKGAITDALKKAATLFGVGLELYGPDYGSGEAAERHEGADLPARGRTTSQNTIPPVGEDNPLDFGSTRGRRMPTELPSHPDTPPGWTTFWAQARKDGLSSKAEAEAAIGHLGADPEYALERLAAWAHDRAKQPVLSS